MRHAALPEDSAPHAFSARFFSAREWHAVRLESGGVLDSRSAASESRSEAGGGGYGLLQSADTGWVLQWRRRLLGLLDRYAVFISLRDSETPSNALGATSYFLAVSRRRPLDYGLCCAWCGKTLPETHQEVLNTNENTVQH